MNKREGQVYVNVSTTGLTRIVSVDLPTAMLTVEHSIFDEKPYKEKISLQKFNWAVDRADLVLRKIVLPEDLWMMNEIRRVLKECFGLQTILRTMDPQRLASGIDVLKSKTGFRKAFLYSVLEDIREMQL